MYYSMSHSQNVTLPVPSQSPHDYSHVVYTTMPSQYVVPIGHPIKMIPNSFHRNNPSMIVELFPFNSVFFGDMEAHVDTFFVALRDIYGDEFMKWWLLKKLDLPIIDLKPYILSSEQLSITSQHWKLLDVLGYPIQWPESGSGMYPEHMYIEPTKLFMYWKIIHDYYCDPTLDGDLLTSIENALEPLNLYYLTGSDDVSTAKSVKEQVLENHDSFYSAFCYAANQAFGLLWDSTPSAVNLFQRRLRKDYFKTILPNLTFGAPMRVPVDGPFLDDKNGVPKNLRISSASNTQIIAEGLATDFNHTNPSSVYVTGGSIRELMQREDIQRYMDRLNFAGGDGSHQKDLYEALYGDSPDHMTLGRAYWINSYRRSVMMQEVVQTSNNDNDSDPLGTKAANGTIATRGEGFTMYCKDYGYIFDLFSLMPKVAYAFNPRGSFRSSVTDWYIPDLQLIGEQEVLMKDVSSLSGVADNPASDPDELFGYQPRYQELREKADEIHSGFRTVQAGVMIHGQEFPGEVNLNEDFIQYPNELFNRVFSYINPQADTCYLKYIYDWQCELPLTDNPTRLD